VGWLLLLGGVCWLLLLGGVCWLLLLGLLHDDDDDSATASRFSVYLLF
jgi:hypothetical protein